VSKATGEAKAGGSLAPSESKQGESFLTDGKTLRARAREHIMDGAVTASYGADRGVILKPAFNAMHRGRQP